MKRNMQGKKGRDIDREWELRELGGKPYKAGMGTGNKDGYAGNDTRGGNGNIEGSRLGENDTRG